MIEPVGTFSHRCLQRFQCQAWLQEDGKWRDSSGKELEVDNKDRIERLILRRSSDIFQCEVPEKALQLLLAGQVLGHWVDRGLCCLVAFCRCAGAPAGHAHRLSRSIPLRSGRFPCRGSSPSLASDVRRRLRVEL